MLLKNNKLIENLDDLKDICDKHKKSGKKIVITNGCFDILHSGHTYLLEEAKKNGDILVLALNSDKSIKKLKSDSRPIVNETDRAYVLSCLSSIDYIILFDEDSPEKIIHEILPDILVKGSDYKNQEIAGAQYMRDKGKEIKLIDLVEDKSTTSIIEIILKKN